MRAAEKIWTGDEVRALGVRTDVPTASVILGLSVANGYKHCRAGTFPVPVLSLGRNYVVPVAGLLSALGLSDERATAAAS